MSIEAAHSAIAAGKLDAARTLLLRLHAKTGHNDARVCDLLRLVFAQQGQHAQALFYAERAAQIDPNHAGLWADLAACLVMVGKNTQAREAASQALALDPNLSAASMTLSAAMLASGQLAKAREVLTQAHQRDPGNAQLQFRLAATELETMEPDAALARIAKIRRSEIGQARSEIAGIAEVHASLANYASLDAEITGLTPERIASLHRDVGTMFSTQVGLAGATFRRANGIASQHKPLRVGLLSADFRAHSVPSFLSGWLGHLDPSVIELTLLHRAMVSDSVTYKLKNLAHKWVDVSRLQGPKLFSTIEGLKLDVLIELNGLTGHHVLASLIAPDLAVDQAPEVQTQTQVQSQGHTPGVRKAAPMLATYLGYPNTTGCPWMDLRFVDRVTDPPESQAFMVERLVTLGDGCFVSYDPPSDGPAISKRSFADGIVFGSFNNPQKLCTQTLGLFRNVLLAVPRSTLMLKFATCNDPHTREVVMGILAREGFDPSRVTLAPHDQSFSSHLEKYNQVHIALDPFPYNGTTTTCEALFMATPVVTLCGNVHASRVGTSILRHSGFGELVAQSPEQFVHIAAGLASDQQRLETYHRTLRERFIGSSVCNGADFATRFTQTLLREAAGSDKTSGQ